jgi:hypothetical protein
VSAPFIDPEAERLAEDTITGPPSPLRISPMANLPPSHHRRTNTIGGKTTDRLRGLHTSYGVALSYGELEGDALKAWDGREDVARALASRIGIALEGASTWAIDGHELAVALWRDHDDLFVVRVHAGWPEGSDALTLAQAFAVAVMGELRRVGSAPELKRWKLWMLIELGFVEPFPVSLPPLPADAPTSAAETWRVVGALLSIRWLAEPVSEPFTFSAPWVARAFKVPEHIVRAGKDWLEVHGFLVRVGTCPGTGKPAVLWVVAEPRGEGGAGA